MPLKPKYQKIKTEFIKKYGSKKGEKLFFAWVNKQNVNPEAKSFVFGFEIKSIKDDVVEGTFASGLPDAYNDILTEDCLKDMDEQLETLPITIDDDHESFTKKEDGEKFKAFNPIAKVYSHELNDFRIDVKTKLNKAHQRYEEIKSSIKNGFLHSFSFAFIPVDWEHKVIEGVRHRLLKKVNLLNGCFTGIPVNDDSQFGSVALKSMRDSFEFNEEEIKSLIGGILMTEDNKEKVDGKEPEKKEPETKEPEKKEPEKKEPEKKEPEKEPEKKEPENKEPADDGTKEEVKSLTVDLKSMVKAVDELKAKSEEEFKSLKAKIDTHDEILNAPVFKAQMQQMDSALSKEEIDKRVEEAKSKSILKSIRK